MSEIQLATKLNPITMISDGHTISIPSTMATPSPAYGHKLIPHAIASR